uniref:Laminin subunit alpha-4 n=1 Tax=Oncorhynchus mykiss TaxID=8022 RepID=A0A8C7U775_ONCMY
MKVCAKLYFLSNQKKCLPCNCKGHSETCEDITGVCTSCQDHTTGNFCEICEDGYMPDVANHGRHSCQPCACPLSSPSNNFAEHCDRSSNILRCNCQEGYAGHYCERCAPGFYGNPMVIGDSCKSCDCNGNSDPNHIFNECHNVTGFCQNCWGDTAGANCERCAPGFYGDAISAKNCRVCECSKCGTASCDDRTGTCHCKPGVTGQLCDQCEKGHTGFNNCQGCHSCDCGPAGLRPTCHPLTHSCQCKPGAGGRYCERCLPDYWNYGPSGCQKCDCASSHCDMHTGECLPESTTVNLCNISKSCDECIWHLIGDLRASNKTLDQVKVSVLNISTGAAANDRLKYYNYTAQRLKNVTEYHAAIDGASKGLQEKTEVLPLTDRDLVLRARDHAEDLQGQAEELEYNLKRSDANGFVQKVLVTANVYNNIVQYIEEANITGLTTMDLATRAEDVGCLKSAISRTTKRLELTEEVAEGTLNRSVEVLQTITPIHEKVEEWATNMKNQDYSAAAFDHAVVSAGEAVENLSELVPELLDKLRVVEEKNQVNNVTTNIMRIRELIAQARSVAKKVQVSMKFNGQSSDLKTVTTISLFIRVDPDKDPIEDRFIFYLGDRNGRKDYMGLAIKNDNLVYVYNLGEEDVEIPLGSKPVSQWPPVFNLIKVERLGRHGKVFLTVPSQTSTDEQKFIQKGEAFGTDSLFDLDPEDTVFFVGGVPADVRLPPALSLAPFVGCIELASLNNDVISMYNFKQTHKMDVVASTPCPRYKLAFSQSRIASYLFDGTGYALINNMERRGKFGIVTRFDIAVRTVANNGILLLMVNGDNFFMLELKNGFLRLMYDFGFSGGPIVMESNSPKLQINDARYHEVSVIYHYSKKFILLVDKSHVKSMENEKKTLPFSDIYIGGAPSPDLSSLVGLKGCVKGFQFQKKDFNLLEEPGTIGISSGCPEEYFMSRKAYFTGEGYLGSGAKISPFDSFEGGLNFRTLQPTGLLFYHSEGSDEFTITLENGAVVLNSRGTRVKSQKKQYNDGITHFLVASVNNNKYELVVDDKDKHEKKRPTAAPSASTVRNFYFGGSPSSSIKNFTGCISYAYISRQDRDIEPEDFQKYTENVQTSLQDCPVKRPPAALFLKQSKNSAKPKQGHTRKVGRDKSNLPKGLLGLNSDEQKPGETEDTPCYLSPRPRATRHAHHYGGTANSRQEFTDIPGSLSKRSHFSLSLKTQSSFGLIFYTSDEAEDNFMALFLAHGKLVYTFNLGQQRVKIKSLEKYNDGAWHNVIFIRDGNLGRLVIDGLTVLEDRAQGSNVSWHVSSQLYLGGVPPGRAQRNIQRNSAYSFTGCVKNLQLNGQWMSSMFQTFGVTPCFEGLSEPGTYFSEEGGYVVLDDTFNLGLKFELVVEVRPRVASGVLLHVYTAAGEYLTMYIHQGAVIVLVNNGVREFFTQVTPRLGLCDGSWHRITLIRDANVVQLDVDSEVNHVVGPLNPSTKSARTPVFIGGAPESLLPEGIATRRDYTGCMRKLTVNESQVSFSKAALVSGAVSVGSCPAA